MNILDFFSKYNKFIIFGGLLIATLSFINIALSVGAMFVFFLTAASLFLIGRCKGEKQIRILSTLFLIVFALYILLTLFFYYTKFQPFSGGYGDYVLYQYQAEQIAQRVHQGNFSVQGIILNDNPVRHCYSVIVGYIYALTTPNMLIGQLFNAWLVAVLIVFVYLIVVKLGGTEKEGFLTGLMACFYPSLAFFGSLLLKEALVILLALMALFLTLKIIKRFSIANFFLLYITLIILTNLRFYISYAIILAFIIGWVLISNFKIKKRIIYAIIMLILFGFLPMATYGGGYLGVDILKKYLNPKTITFYREQAYAPVKEPPKNPGLQPDGTWVSTYSADKNSSMIIKTGFENPLIFVKNTGLSFLYSLFGPLPWRFTKRSQLFSLPEIIASYFLIFFAVKGTIRAVRDKNKVIILLVLFSLIVVGVVAVFFTNFGLVTRLRMPAFLALLCLLPLGFKRLKDINIPLLKKVYE